VCVGAEAGTKLKVLGTRGSEWLDHLHLDVDGSRLINGVCNEGFTVIRT
jgi:hypothetical protein